MIKFLIIIFFINFILIKNKIIIFYYNLYYLISLIILFIYIFKDIIWNRIVINIGIEYYSIWLLILSVWIVSLIIICLDKKDIKVMFMFINLLFLLLMFFLSIDLIIFYLIFEIRLIPTFFLIIYWGSNIERVGASYYLIIYILFISFPLLVYIIKIYNYSLTLKFRLLGTIIYIYIYSFGGFLFVYMSFFIKMPIYIIHVWLPKAHVEAPVYGSIILAGVLLKIGRYGLLRLMEIFIFITMRFNYLIFRIGIVGRFIVGVLCLVQIDMKRLVAYSSVVHINIMLCSFMRIFKLGVLGAYIIIISHGLCSSGLFYMVNLYYSRTGSRLLVFNKGIIRKLPSFTVWWFLLCVANFSFPFSLNFFRELIILRVILNWNLYIIIYLILICFFRSAYSLYLFSYIQHGPKRFSKRYFNIGLIKEFLMLVIHFYPLIIFILNLIIFI